MLLGFSSRNGRACTSCLVVDVKRCFFNVRDRTNNTCAGTQFVLHQLVTTALFFSVHFGFFFLFFTFLHLNICMLPFRLNFVWKRNIFKHKEPHVLARCLFFLRVRLCRNIRLFPLGCCVLSQELLGSALQVRQHRGHDPGRDRRRACASHGKRQSTIAYLSARRSRHLGFSDLYIAYGV